MKTRCKPCGTSAATFGGDGRQSAEVIFLAVPFILVGVVVGLFKFDQPFGSLAMALLGFLSLVGTAVTVTCGGARCAERLACVCA